MNYQKYTSACAKENIPVRLRHWAWNMQKPGMQVFAFTPGMRRTRNQRRAIGMAMICS